MSDRYQFLAQTSMGRLLVGRLGLPDPVTLERYRPGQPLVEGVVLVGGAAGGRLLDGVRRTLAGLGIPGVDSAVDGQRYKGLVFDASGITASADLVALQEFFTPVLRQLEPCGRVVVLGTPPEATDAVAAHVAQRALEGFTRSLAKEVGHGSSAQLVYVARGAEHAVSSTLGFLLSPKSAYVSGQVVRIDVVADTSESGSADETAEDRLRPLDGKVALVTGAARGIGAAIARTLARDGAAVVGVDVAQAAPELLALTAELGGSSLTLDVTTIDAPQRIARHLADQHGGVDVVVHNAGIARDRRLVNMAPDRWQSTLAVNLTAPERITAELLDQRLVRPQGRVVGVASVTGISGNLGQTNYATSKAGVVGLVEALAPRLPDGITVNAVAPGFIETEMTARMPVLLREAGRRMNSMSQGGLPVDVAETVAWLAAPGSGGVTGNVVRVCGQSLLGA